MITRTSLTLLLLAAPLHAAVPAPQQQKSSWPPPRASVSDALRDCQVEKPDRLFMVERVVDGDTIHIRRNGEREKLRLLSVDTEEKYMGGKDISASKPSTRFAEQSTGWATGFLLPRSPGEGPAKVGLRFPGGEEARDIYGRLLCHVVTKEGIDFNLLLVRMGHSPYFNKYGNSRLDHERFLEAQRKAMAEKLGIWDSRTNEGGKRRDYPRLMAWWTARAEAIDAFRARAAASPGRFLACDDPDGLEAALKAGGGEVTLLASVDRFFDEDDGSWTSLLRSGDRKRAVRIGVPASGRAALEALDLPGTKDEFRQNYLLVTGQLTRGPRGFRLEGVGASGWRRAGPEPVTAGQGR
ncbi:MAG: thermonuclease family protein, partial [Planctomycetota bacterium]